MGNPLSNPLADDALAPVTADLEGAADRLASFPPVAGVQLASYVRGQWSTASAGFADVDRGVLLRDATRFRPGSITKLLTATLLMQCVDDGLVDLDAPVRPLTSRSIDDRVRVRHLISHSSGIDAGDLFVAFDGPRAVDDYAALLDDVPQLFAPGQLFSYNNAGFVLAGLIVQRLRGADFESVARQRVIEPLGLTSTEFMAGHEVAARHATDATGDPPYAAGHLALPGQLVRVPDQAVIDDPVCSRGLGPAGGTLVSTAHDLCRFAAAHLGVGDTEVVSPASASLMRELHAEAPGGVAKMAGVGFGWQIWTHGERRVPRIGGANPGQSGLVAVDPAAGSALVALTNSDQGINAVTAMLDGFGPAATPTDVPAPDDLSEYCGTYRSHAMAVRVELADAALTMRLVDIADVRWGATQASSLTAFGITDVSAVARMTFSLTPIDRTTFASPVGPIAFLRPSRGAPPEWMRWRMRVQHRVADDRRPMPAP